MAKPQWQGSLLEWTEEYIAEGNESVALAKTFRRLRISRLGLPAYISFPRREGDIHGLHGDQKAMAVQ